MEEVFRVKEKDGTYSYYKDRTKALKREDEIALEEKRELERKQKDEAERKAKEEKTNSLVKQIKQQSNELYDLLKQYEEQEGHGFIYYAKDFKDVNLPILVNKLVNGYWSF
jgi:DNA repair exonuclease SbcCD ATPase subunit